METSLATLSVLASYSFFNPTGGRERERERERGRMSCNGCRVLRRGCGESCVLRSCLEWIESPQAQGNATLFVSKFFGRSDLLNFITAVPERDRPALFRSLLFEACGRTVNPVSGAIGLLSTGNWHICQAAVQTVLAGGILQPSFMGALTDELITATNCGINFPMNKNVVESSDSEGSGMVINFGTIEENPRSGEPKLLNLFV